MKVRNLIPVMVVGLVGVLWLRWAPHDPCPGGPDGPHETYHENGQVWWKGTWSKGEECGEWTEDGEAVTYDPCPSN